MKSTKLIICICFTTLVYTLQAQVSLSSLFTDHMVLQQKTDASVWGWGAPGEILRVVGSWSLKDTVKVRVGSLGQWKTKITTPQAGGPYNLKVWGSSKIELKDVMIGEVWLCSGQSNMAWSHMQSVFNKEKEIASANHTNIRIFQVPTRGSEHLQNHLEAQWEECRSATMKSTSAVGYFFARELMQKMDVPVGIIVSAWGGTPAEVWTPEQVFTTNPTLNENRVPVLQHWPMEIGVLYNQMINPIVPYSLAGAIWYQGESNIIKPHSYGLLMKKLIESWRGAFSKEFPFYFVQIAPFKYNNPDSLAATLREQQELTAKTTPKTGMVVISDLVDDVKDIHPRNKLDVGIRLANMAMARTYNQPIKSYQSPTYKSVEFKNKRAYISFNDVVTDLEIRGEQAVGFMIASDDGKFVPAKALVKDGVVIVQTEDVKTPTAVRYCFDNATIGNIFTKEGLPLAPFRTDSRTIMLQ